MESRQKESGIVFYPLGLGYLASYLRKHINGIHVEIFKNIKDLLNFSPDITGLSAMSSNFPAAVSDALLIKKELNRPVFLGGTHISGIPESLPDIFDGGVVGEGEETLRELAELFIKKPKASINDLATINGLVLKIGDKTCKTPNRNLIKPLDLIPFPARDWKDPVSSSWSFTSRGCPYRCSFCYSSLMGSTVRMNTPQYAAEEVFKLSSKKSHHTFLDDLFCADIDRVEEISEILYNSGLNKRFTVTARADLITKETAKTLEKLGAEYVHLGLESGSGKVLKYLKKDRCSVSINKNALQILSSYGIKPIGTFIIGSPYETQEDLEKTCKFIKETLETGIMADFSFGPLLPFPGTEIWNNAVKEGIIDPNTFDWQSLKVDIRNFDKKRYTLLNKQIKPNRFYYYFDRLKEMLLH